MFRLLLHRSTALILALNYFFFQVELSEEEYEANHPKHSDEPSCTSPSLNWETFDKTNAPQAFVFDAGFKIDFLFQLPSPQCRELPAHPQFRLPRDKSPPQSSLI